MVKVYDLHCNAVEEIKLPDVFSEKIKPEVIKKAFLAEQSNGRQPYGSDVLAGKRTSAHYHGRRKYRYAMMNKEMSRIPRIHGRVGHYHMRARFAPHAVKGRAAHPPKSAKQWAQKINKKEYSFALRSSLSCSAENALIFIDELENISKTKEARKVFAKLLAKEMERAEKKKVRPGRGKMRGRRYQRKKGPLLVVSRQCGMLKAARNMAGFDVVEPRSLKITHLAPGGNAGRRLILTKSAVSELNKLLS